MADLPPPYAYGAFLLNNQSSSSNVRHGLHCRNRCLVKSTRIPAHGKISALPLLCRTTAASVRFTLQFRHDDPHTAHCFDECWLVWQYAAPFSFVEERWTWFERRAHNTSPPPPFPLDGVKAISSFPTISPTPCYPSFTTACLRATPPASRAGH